MKLLQLRPKFAPRPSFRPITSTKANVIAQLLQNMNSVEEMDQYLQVYGTPGIQRTAVIKIGGEILQTKSALNDLITSLSFLQAAGLFPILVHGAGPQMNEALEENGQEPQYYHGMRVTTASTLATAKRVFQKTNLTLVDALTRAGMDTRPITNGVFEALLKDEENLGLVGEVTNIIDDPVRSAIHLGQIPVLSCMGESPTGQLLNINADVAARELAIKLQPHKTIFVTAKGGWLEDDGTKLRQIVMTDDFERMAARDYTGKQGTLLKLKEIKLLLDALPETSSVVLTSAAALSKEVLDNSSDGTVCTRGKPAKFASEPITFDTEPKVKVGILGARGYVGRELIRLIGQHPKLELVCSSSRALEGQKVVDVALAPPLNPHTNLPCCEEESYIPLRINNDLRFCSLTPETLADSAEARSVDVWVLALPNGHSDNYVEAIRGIPSVKPKIIDLSADQRFNSEWVYGLPEMPHQRERLRKASLISNPGCYATAMQLALLPLLSPNPLLQDTPMPHMFGVSGYSGAGTGRSDSNNMEILEKNLLAYSPVQHIHEKEVSYHTNTPIAFMPHVAPYFRGIHMTMSAHISTPLTSTQLEDVYKAYYATEPLVHVQTSIPQVKHNQFHHGVHLGGFQLDPRCNRVVAYATIDNLLKGAATQALQNLNLAMDLDEFTAIDTVSTATEVNDGQLYSY